MTDNGIDFHPTHVERLTWHENTNTLPALRAPWCDIADIEDADAYHYLASRHAQAVGYLRINASGELSCIGAKANALDIHQALLRFALMDAPLHDLQRLFAPTVEPWKTLLPDIGFVPSTHNDNQLDYFTPPHRTRQATGSDLVRLEHMDDLRRFSLELAQTARRSIVIYSNYLDAWLYDNDAFSEAVVKLVHNSQFSSVRMLVRDSRAIRERGHRLLTLCHHASEHVSIRKITAANHTQQPAYLIVDDNGLLYRSDDNAITGIGYRDYRGRVKMLLTEFDLMWNSAQEDPDLRRMTV